MFNYVSIGEFAMNHSRYFRWLAVGFLALCCAPAFATSPLDGIYSCQVSSAGGNALAYIAVNSNASTTVVTLPSLQGGSYVGYVIGSIASATAFSGTSNYGYAYTATATGTTGAKILLVNGTFNSTLYGPLAVTATCSQLI